MDLVVEILPAWVTTGREGIDGDLSGLTKKHKAGHATMDEGIRGAFAIPET